MKTVHRISAYIIVGLGLIHTLATPIFYSGFTEDGLWFAGTGLGLVFLGLLNLEVIQNQPLQDLTCVLPRMLWQASCSA